MNKIVKIGFPMEYENDEHIIRIGLWLKEYEVEMLEKKLNEYNHLQSKIDKANEILNKKYEEDKEIFKGDYDFKFILDFEEELLDILKEDK